MNFDQIKKIREENGWASPASIKSLARHTEEIYEQRCAYRTEVIFYRVMVALVWAHDIYVYFWGSK